MSLTPTVASPTAGPSRRVRLLAAGLALASLAAIVLAVLPGRAAEAAPPAPRYLAGELLVKFRPGMAGNQARDILRQHDAEQTDEIAAIGLRRLRVPAGREEEIAARLSRNPNVVYAVPNGVISVTDTLPNDPYFSNGTQWNMNRIAAPAAWDVVTGTTPVTIAVVDTGINGMHPDLAGQVVEGYEHYTLVINNEPVVYSGTIPVGANDDLLGHGTHVSGIAAAHTDNGLGVAGVAWGARIMPIRVFYYNDGSDFDVAWAMVYAADHGAQVINMSLGGDVAEPALQDAANYAWGKGLFLAAAAGNANGATPLYPAADEHVVGVSASSAGDQFVQFGNSGHGYWVDVAAPGGSPSILSTFPYLLYPYYGYASMQGTSMATPHVSGLAALIWSANPALSNGDVLRVITSTAEKVGIDPYVNGWNEWLGHGRINAADAVRSALITIAGPPMAAAGAPITHVLTLQTGGLVLTGTTVITDALPSGATFVSASDGGTFADGVVSWSVGPLDARQSVSRALVFTAAQTVVNDRYGAADGGTRGWRGVLPFTTVVGPVLSITKDGPPAVFSGQPFDYTLVVTNSSVQAATGLVLTDTLPAGATFVAASDGGTEAGGMVSWSVPSLAAGATLTRTLTVTITQAVVNSDYGVASLEGASARGAVGVATSVFTQTHYLPWYLNSAP